MTIYATGVDYANPQTPPHVLVAHGASFACRYASSPGNPKNLTPTEAQNLADAGISIVSVFETTSMRALNGTDAGKQDMAATIEQHAACGRPAGSAIYLTVDFDMQSGQEAAVAAYFKGAHAASDGCPVGVYGGLRVCQFLDSNGPVDLVWQTYAWSDGIWAPITHLRQVHNGVSWDGWSVDLDEAHEPDYGAWRPGGAPPIPPTPPTQGWTANMITDLPTIKKGDTDAGQPVWHVHVCQAVLQDVNGLTLGAIDGDFGTRTDAAVRDYQGRHRLAVDGVVGPHTWAMLLAGQSL